VLSLETGQLEYANAGNNPPILLRGQAWQLEHLERSGMALGVEEGSPIGGKHTRLEPGDFLILYTDGITEAFAPDGDLYGEERLHQTIWSTGVCASNADDPAALSAQDMLEAIDQSVANFINDTALSDDLTLVVLKRSPDVGGARPAI